MTELFERRTEVLAKDRRKDLNRNISNGSAGTSDSQT
jgi:hypothetical protein